MSTQVEDLVLLRVDEECAKLQAEVCPSGSLPTPRLHRDVRGLAGLELQCAPRAPLSTARGVIWGILCAHAGSYVAAKSF